MTFPRAASSMLLSPWAWGRIDCCLGPVSAWNEVTGENRAADLFGTYSNWIECRRVMVEGGGLLNVARSVMTGARSGEVSNGVAIVETGSKTFGSVLIDGQAHIKTRKGFLMPKAFTIIEGWGF